MPFTETPSAPSLPALSLNTPSLRRRMASWLYECILLFAVAFLATWLFSTLGQMRSGIDPRRPLLITFLFVIFGIYFVWCWAHGQTLPMKTWNIRLVDSKGHAVTQGRALGRYVLSWMWFLPPLIAVAPFRLSAPEIFLIVAGWIAIWALLSRFHPQRQFWHDALAGTRLVTSAPLSR